MVRWEEERVLGACAELKGKAWALEEGGRYGMGSYRDGLDGRVCICVCVNVNVWWM